MSKYSVSERISIAKAYYSSNNSPIAAQRKFSTEHKLKTTGPSVITIKNVIGKIERTGSVDVSTLQRFLQNFALPLRHVIAIDGMTLDLSNSSDFPNSNQIYLQISGELAAPGTSVAVSLNSGLSGRNPDVW
ncbi:hypothetical protein AVEN_253412-1 [Araneus ventricosus]|uniref:DUF4817 domain-containing protein n=1 Tax=Araneus ventricosus TaxID=182803 RepID=A0A4Y2K0X5_ARAVE|nr:hypothetical protein AVEN_253412-1 [Araneus ventricosus]